MNIGPIKNVLSITIGLLVIYLVTQWQWAVKASFIIGTTGLLSITIAKAISFVWIKITNILSLILQNILLSFVYVVFLLPLSYLYKLLNSSDNLFLRNTANSLFKERGSGFDKKSFERMW